MNLTKTNAKHIRCQADILKAFREVYGAKGRNGKLRDGKQDMAEWYDVSYQAVCNWFSAAEGGKPRGLPTGYQYRTHLWAETHGYVLHPEVFGYGPDGRPASEQSSVDAP
jgi:hypothetical protein